MIRDARVLLTAALVLVSTACGGGDGPGAPAGVPAQLELSALPDTAGLGDTLSPAVQVRDGRGSVVTGADVAFGTSSATVVAVLPNGKLRAVGEGSAIVRATAGSARDSVRVVVRRLPRKLRILVPVDSIEFGTLQELVPSVAVLDGLGAVMGTAQNAAFSSSDPGILRVDATTGAVTAVNAGSAELVASAGGLEARQAIRATLYEPFAGLGVAAQHSTGRWVTCARMVAGPSYCQTAVSRGLAGAPVVDQTIPLTPVAATAPLVAIGTGSNGSCGLTAAGDALCWGTGIWPLNVGSVPIFTPLALPKPTGVTAWTGFGFNHRSTDHCLLDQAGKAWCWGSNQEGALGPTLGLRTDLWMLEGAAPAFTRVATSLTHGCGMTATAELWCWGKPGAFQRTEGASSTPVTPTRVTLPRAIRDFAAVFQGTCVLYVAGDVECWGFNQVGILGRPAAMSYSTPQRVELPANVVSLHAGGVGMCALTATGELWCWGSLRGWDPAGVAPFRFAPGYSFADASLASTGLEALLCARTTTGRVLCTERENSR